MSKQTVLINIFGGPGAGKTVAAMELTVLLKKLGKSVEYIPEYAKELYYEGKRDLLDGSFENENIIIDEKYRRISRYKEKVDYIVCDAPFLQSLIYADKETSTQLNEKAFMFHNEFNTINFLMQRTVEFEQEGRIQSLTQSIHLDAKIQTFLNATIGRAKYSIIDTATFKNSIERIGMEILERKNGIRG